MTTATLCRFFNSDDGCRYGDRCKFLHDLKDTKDTKETEERSVRSDKRDSDRTDRTDRTDRVEKRQSDERRRLRSRSPPRGRQDRLDSRLTRQDHRDSRDRRSDLPRKRRAVDVDNVADEKDREKDRLDRLAICYKPNRDIYEHDMDFMTKTCTKCGIQMGY